MKQFDIPEPEESKIAEQYLLDYTASEKWEDMMYNDWTTSEVHEMLQRYIREQK